MNIQEYDILNAVLDQPYLNQRALAERCGHSLGIVNRSLKELESQGYLDADRQPTKKALAEARAKAPQNAVILAAGFGMRMVPINTQTPKGLLEVHGEPLIERLIKQLNEAGIRDICVVVGFMKEHFEYLIDEYGVELLVNAGYAAKNNLHSLKLTLPRLSRTYIVPCDIWCSENPFRSREFYSWYMVTDAADQESEVRVSRKRELMLQQPGSPGNHMIGIAYLLEPEAERVRRTVSALCAQPRYDGSYWETALAENGRLFLPARIVSAKQAIEINTYEQLRELDSGSHQLQSDAIRTIARVLDASPDEITDICALKKGMTNRSFLFCCRGKKYIMRVPGEGTSQLIDRAAEAAVYRTIAGRGICDNIAYIDPDSGYKITEFLERARSCDPASPEDVRRCMAKVRALHEEKLHVDHTFDLFGQIAFYETLWNGAPSAYRDYLAVKERVFALKPFLEEQAGEPVLTHIDAVPDNFLFVPGPDGEETLRLIDWEYAGMQDPHVDIAMFAIYSFYDRAQVDALIDTYFPEGCPDLTRIKIYGYLAVCGLLWSNWCEYKRSLGVEFGEYSLRQYRYAKEYSRIVQEELSCIR